MIEDFCGMMYKLYVLCVVYFYMNHFFLCVYVSTLMAVMGITLGS